MDLQTIINGLTDGPLLAFLPFIIVVAVISYSFEMGKSNENLQRWASTNGFKLLNSQRRRFRRGPFFFVGSHQEVFRVKVMDLDGTIKLGYVRVGGFFAGQLSDRSEACWDKGLPVRQGFSPITHPENDDLCA